MKKIVLLIIPIVLIATIGIIVFLNRNSEDNNILAQNDSQDVGSNNAASEEKVDSNEELVDYWVNTYEFPKETKEFSLNLWNGFIAPPIKLADLENKCDYLTYHGGDTYAEMGEHKIKKFSEIKKTLNDGGKLNVYLHMNDDSFAELSGITIENFSEESKTAQECIENGWWYDLVEFGYNSQAAEFFEIELPPDDRDSGIYILEDIITKLGRPTKILASEGSFKRQEKMGMEMYDIVYEYSDFVLVIHTYEIVYFNNNRYGYCNINGASYFTPESWKNHWRNDTSKVNFLN